MIKYRDECVGCRDMGLPCYGSSCRNRNVPVYFCDWCDTEIYGEVFHYDGDDLCSDCREKYLEENDDLPVD